MVTELNGEEDNLTSNRIIILNVHLSCQYFHLYLNIFMSSKLTWRGNYQHLAYIVKKNHKTFKKKKTINKQNVIIHVDTILIVNILICLRKRQMFIY